MPAPIDSEPEGDIILSAAEARQIAQFLSLLLNGGRRGLARASVPQTKPQTDDASPERRAKLVARAKAVLVERKRRNQFFPLILFGEIGWEMLLWLYVTDHSGERQTLPAVKVC